MTDSLPQVDIALPRGDRTVIWPTLIAVGVAIVAALAWATIVGFFPLLLFVLILFGVTTGIPLVAAFVVIALLIVAIRSILRREWRRAISYAVPSVVVLAIVFNIGAIANLCREVGDRAHFYLMRSRYIAEVAAKSGSGQPRLLVWNWGGMLWSSKGVVYDESDEIMRPTADQTADWKSRAGSSELACGDYGFEPMGDHFYLAYFPC